jgi:hypothetical protein
MVSHSSAHYNRRLPCPVQGQRRRHLRRQGRGGGGSTRSLKREECMSTYSFCCCSRSRDNPNEMEVRYAENGTEDQYAYDRRRGDRVGVTLATGNTPTNILSAVSAARLHLMRTTFVESVQVIVFCNERPPCAGCCTTFPSPPHRPPHRQSREARRPSEHRTVRLDTTEAVVGDPSPRGECHGFDNRP